MGAARRFRLAIDPMGEVQWTNAIGMWKLGNPSELAELLRGDEPIPPSVREWLAQALGGNVRRWNAGERRKFGPVFDTEHLTASRFLQEWRILELFGVLRAQYASQRRSARAAGIDPRAEKTDEDAAAEALAAHGRVGGLRAIHKLKARRRALGVIRIYRPKDMM